MPSAPSLHEHLEHRGESGEPASLPHDLGPAGAIYDLRFLDGMLQHHGGALQMANDALGKRTNPTIRRLARQSITAQRREILEIRRMRHQQGLS